MIINRLIKKGQLDQFQDEINKKINIGCLEQVPEAEIGALLKRVNHFCYLQLVFSESSESTSTRMINNTLTGTPGGTSFSIENKVPVSEIGDSHESILNSTTGLGIVVTYQSAICATWWTPSPRT